MAQTLYPELKTYFNITNGYESLTTEASAIPAATPYRVTLAQIPAMKAGITSLDENVFDVATVAAVLVIEVNDGTDAIPSWTVRTPVDVTNPANDESYVQTADYPYSSQLFFHADDAGKACRVTYVGFGSPVLAEQIARLVDHVDRLESSLPLRMFSEGAYHRGWFSPDGVELSDNTKRVYIAKSGFAIRIEQTNLTWDGDWADFSAAGNCESSAFTDADYFRSCYLYLEVDGGVLVPAMVEGAEAATALGVVAPDPPVTEHIGLGYIVVENDGTPAIAGHILPIAQADITSEVVLAYSQEEATRRLFPVVFKTFGDLTAIVGGDLDNAVFLGTRVQIDRFTLICEDTGSGGDDLMIDIQVKESGGWVSLFAADVDKPTITANTGTYQIVTTPSTDMDFSVLDAGINDLDVTAIIRVLVDTAPTASANACGVLWCVKL